MIGYFRALFTLVIMDALNLGVINRTYYGNLFPDGIQSWFALTLFYVLYPYMVYRMVKTYSQSWKDSARLGAYLGLLVYGTYHLTNKATLLRPWPWTFVLMDTAWGVLVTTIIATASGKV